MILYTYTYKEGETDGLVVYLPKIDRLCYFPPNVYIGKKTLCIRIKPTKNNQAKKIVDAKKYSW